MCPMNCTCRQTVWRFLLIAKLSHAEWRFCVYVRVYMMAYHLKKKLSTSIDFNFDASIPPKPRLSESVDDK